MTALAVYAVVVTVLLVVAVAFLVVLVQDGRKIAKTAAQRMVADRAAPVDPWAGYGDPYDGEAEAHMLAEDQAREER